MKKLSEKKLDNSLSVDNKPKTIVAKLRDHERKEKLVRPEERLREIFTLDKSLIDDLNLPVRLNNQRSLVSSSKSPGDVENLSRRRESLVSTASTETKKRLQKDVVKHSANRNGIASFAQVNNSQAINNFSFLPEAIGISSNRQSFESEKSYDSDGNINKNQVQQEISAREQDDVAMVLSTIKSDEDALNYFARYGSETSLKFIHLMPSNNQKTFCPYDLVVTSQNELAVEHFIMSSNGIVHVTPHEQSDCIPLATWMKQKINFRILRMIPFFKYYLHRKVFSIWFENVRYQLFLKQRKKVTERLFLARKTTCPAILATKRHLKEIQGVQLLSLIGLDFKPCDKEVIMERQLAHLAKAGNQFEEFVRRIIQEVNNVVDTVNNLHHQAYQDQSANLLAFADTITPEKLKSLVRLKQEKQERKILRFRARVEYHTLPDFVRYMDYIVIENFFEFTVHGIEKFYDEFVKTRKTGIFETMIRFTGVSVDSQTSSKQVSRKSFVQRNETTTTVFSPTCQEIQDMMGRLFDNVVDTVGNLNRVGYITIKPPTYANVANMQSTLGMTSTAQGGIASTLTGAIPLNNAMSGTMTNITNNMSALPPSSLIGVALTSSIQNILHENNQFCQVLENIRQKIITDYERAEEHALSYESIKPIYKFNSEWSIDLYRVQGYDITQLKTDLERITNWMKDLDKLRNRPIGILDVDSRKLKLELSPVLEVRLLEIKEYIKEMARYRCQQLLDHYKDSITKFALRPNILKEFANQIQFVLTSKEDEKNLFIQTSQVDQMYNLLQYYDVPIPSEDSVLHEQLHDRQIEYKKEINLVSTFHEQNRLNMVQAVNDNIIKLNKNIDQFLEKLDDPDFTMTLHYEDSDTILDDLDLRSNEFKQLNDQSKTYSNYQRLLNEPCTDYKELQHGSEKLSITKKLWETISTWNQSYEEWNESQFSDLDVDDIEKCVNNFIKETVYLNKVISCKATDKLTNQVNDFKSIMPSILALGNKHMKSRHFEKLFKLINQVYYQGMPFTLYQIRKGGLMNHKDIIHDTSDIASGEALLEDSLTKIKDYWEKAKFPLKLYKEQSNLHILGSLHSILTILDEHLVILQNMLTSRYIKGLQERVEVWDKKLNQINDVIDDWIICQKHWIYLDNIFGNDDIQKQLPSESQKFFTVDRSWKTIMTRTLNDPLVVNCLLPIENAHNSLLISSMLQNNNEILELILKGLEDYLDTKRQIFPRLYFLSNEELLELLSQTKDSHAINFHITKCFDGVKSLSFQSYDNDKVKGKIHRGYDEIIGFTDDIGEYVKFQSASTVNNTDNSMKGKDIQRDSLIVRAEGSVEQWLVTFEKMMRMTVYSTAREATKKYPTTTQVIPIDSYMNYISNFPSQVGVVVDEVMWTSYITGALYALQNNINTSTIVSFGQNLNQHVENLINVTQRSLSRIQRSMINQLLIQSIHNRDITKNLIDKNVVHLGDFEWIKQMRYYWDLNQDNILIKQTHCSLFYGYEYIGNTSRLVITPLTDLCFMTLTNAIGMHQGGAIQGSAGIGKTETIRELSKAAGVHFIVFNCSRSLDYISIGRLFRGLVQQGSWLCLDEFNRIDIEVLSVVAQQVLAIEKALQRKAAQFEFDGKILLLNHNASIFLTMNQTGTRDVGLPENLKSLFRPVCMTSPNMYFICNVILCTEGFTSSRNLSSKIIHFLSLCQDHLSKQMHYDFGLRSMKSLLSLAGNLKRREQDSNEEAIILRCLRDGVSSRLEDHDLSLMNGILSDLFPGLKVPSSESSKVSTAIDKVIQTMSLQKSPVFCSKILQIHDLQQSRNAIALIGSTGSGKTTCLRVLSTAYGLLRDSSHGSSTNESQGESNGHYGNVDMIVVNPIALGVDYLYGNMNPKTHEWQDGLISTIIRDAAVVSESSITTQKWIIFDGPVHSDWVENMNTALDETKTLCLVNSERIKIPTNIQIVFEALDLNHANPSIVSRCGVVHVDQSCIGILSIIRTWSTVLLSRFMSRQSAKSVASTIEANIEVAVNFVHSNCYELVPSTGVHLVQSFLNLFIAKLIEYLNIDYSIVTETNLPPVVITASENLVQDIDLLNAMVLWCLIWSIGGNIDEPSRPLFQEWCRTRFSTTISSKYNLLLHDPFGTSFDLVSKEVKLWSSFVPTLEISTIANSNHGITIIPTVDTVRYSDLLQKLTACNQHLLLIGDASVGKSMIVNSFLMDKLKKGRSLSHTIRYTSHTNVSDIHHAFESNLEKKRKTVLAPAQIGAKFYLHLDDMNLSSSESNKVDNVTGSTRVNELLRQILESGGYYDAKKLYFKSVQDVICIGAMNPNIYRSFSSKQIMNPVGSTIGGVSSRLLRKFHLLSISSHSSGTIRKIYTSIVDAYLHSVMGNEFNSLLTNTIVSTTINVYEDIKTYFRISPNKLHYHWSLLEISKIFIGMTDLTKKRLLSAQHLDSNYIMRLWCHETCRVLRDRLVSIDDRHRFDNILYENTNRAITDYNIELTNSANQTNVLNPIGSEEIGSLLFTNLLSVQSVPGEIREYKEFNNVDKIETELHSQFQQYQAQNPIESKSNNLVFFEDAIKHLLRLSRIISQTHGHGLLLSNSGGSGRTTMTKLLCYMQGYKYYSIDISSKGYNFNQFEIDLSTILIDIGISDKPSVFFIHEKQLFDNRVLEILSSILHTSDVFSFCKLSTEEDIDRILNDVRINMKAIGKEKDTESKSSVLDYFKSSIKENFHLVLCLSSMNHYADYFSKFPTLFDKLSYDWYDAWSDTALYSVAYKFINCDKDSSIEFISIKRILESKESTNKIVNGPQDNKQKLDKENLLPEVFKRFHEEVVQFTTNKFENFTKYLTSSTYIEFLRIFSKLSETCGNKLHNKIQKYKNGLTKLEEASIMVSQLEKELKDLQPELERAKDEANALIENITSNEKIAESHMIQIDIDVKKAEEAAIEVNLIKDECQYDLNQAMPEYDAAISALDTLDKKSIQELKIFPNPPELVKLTLEAVCILLDKQNTQWSEAQKLLSSMDFMEQLKNYDKDNISSKLIKRVEKIINDPRFVPEEVKRHSLAAMCLCMWVRAMVTYDRVAKKIAPKREALEHAEEKLSTSQILLSKKQTALKDIRAKIDSMQIILSETQKKKTDYESKIESSKTQMNRALDILEGLKVEKFRWEEILVKLDNQLKPFVGDMCLASGYVTYMGLFEAEDRVILMNKWMEICSSLKIDFSKDFNILNTLIDSNSSTLNTWRQQGLPNDRQTQENALIIHTCVQYRFRWPFIIDPDDIIGTWIRNLYAGSLENPMRVLNHNDPRDEFMSALDDCIRHGNPLLIENASEDLDPSLEPALLYRPMNGSNTQTSGTIRVGNIDIPYDFNFKLYLTTKTLKPSLTADLSQKVTAVTFHISSISLEEQLLNEIVQTERPDIADKEIKCNTALAEDNQQLEDIENTILALLTKNTAKDLLENDDLIASLNKAKSSSTNILSHVRETQNASQEIQTLKESYRPIATRGSVLYETIRCLSVLDSSYIYSLAYFKSIFHSKIVKSEKKESLRHRIAGLTGETTKTVLQTISNSLLNKDRLIFSFLLAVNVQKRAKVISNVEWQIFVDGLKMNGTNMTSTSTKRQFPSILAQMSQANPKYPITEQLWSKCVVLESTLSVFEGICGDIMGKSSAWAQYFGSDTPSAHRLPGTWESKLSDFQKLILLRFTRETMVITGIQRYITNIIGESFVDIQTADIKEIFEQSTNRTPILHVLRSGMDPLESIIQLGNELGIINVIDDESTIDAIINTGGRGTAGVGLGGLHVLSLGKGQEQLAQRAIEECQRVGHWLCIQNCHLLPTWLPNLEAHINHMAKEGNINPNFRLWLTTFPTMSFPQSILRNSIKIACEPPKGIRANLLYIMSCVTVKEYETSCRCSNPSLWRRITFALAFFNAIVLERIKFGSIGWNVSYNWTVSDFRACMETIKIYIDEFTESLRVRSIDHAIRTSISGSEDAATKINLLNDSFEVVVNSLTSQSFPWIGLKASIGDILYGSRVIDPWDKRLLKSILDKILRPELLFEESHKLFDLTDYPCPSENATREEVIDHISKFPIQDSAEVFGLHLNISTKHTESASIQFLKSCMQIQCDYHEVRSFQFDSFESIKADEDKVREVITNIVDKIPNSFKSLTPYASTFESHAGIMNPLGAFLSQEIAKYEVLLLCIHKTLEGITSLLSGDIAVNDDLESIFKNFVDNQVPLEWKAVSYPTGKTLSSWIDDLHSRIQFLSNWISDGPPNAYWISAFIHPQGFLSAIKQAYARKHRTPIDSLSIEYEITSFDKTDIRQVPYNGAFIYGLHIEGGKYNRISKVIEESTNGVLLESMPCILVKIVPAISSFDVEHDSLIRLSGMYVCPVYKVQSRGESESPSDYATSIGYSNNYIFALPLPIQRSVDDNYWIQRGCALICSTND